MANALWDALAGAPADGAPALITSSQELSHAALRAETGRMAAALVALGVAPGDRVAACIEKSAANLVLYLATIRAGAVFLPLNPAYTFAERAFFLRDAEPALVVCDPAARKAMVGSGGAARVETLDAAGEGSLAGLAAGQGASFSTIPRGEDDLAAICYTSGTTGRSKGAMLTHRALVSNARALAELWRFSSRDVLIHALPLYHIHGLFIAANTALMSGAAMRLLPRFDADAVLAAMPGATCLMGVPTFYTRLLDQPGLTREATRAMRLFVSGSAPLLARTHDAWREVTGHAILERYGMTETGILASNPYDGDRVAGSVGFPLPGVDLRLVDGGGQIVAPNAVGAIEVKGPNVCSGYWRNEAATREAFGDDGWFATGDLASKDARGYLSIVGRDKDLIITGGLNVYPKEVEAAIDAAPGVTESAVIGVPHLDLGEAVVAVVTPADAGVSEAAVLSAVGEVLAPYKRPKRILFVAELPRNAMGKVEKARLRADHARLFAS